MPRLIAIVLVLLVTSSGCTKKEPATACCSCTCVASDGSVCSGAKREAHGDETCAERCEAACTENGCQLDESTVINEGACEGGLIPFLAGK